MQVNSTTPTTGTTSTNASSSTAAAAASATVDYNSFLKLLVAQLQNQDPTAPSDPTQFLSQLASFSAVGQSVQTNQKLDTMLTTTALSQAESAIGMTVTSADGTTSGVVSSVAIQTDGTVQATLQSGTKMTLGSGTTIS